ncbi:MAG: orotate phosphoribosyltransferase-like protein [Candidatus Bathyarchaeota archaeon BA1]|nr:MAG: orotate phosphoribosyltransferase-like protein [Candidatus Bathyarchaeota archaeon BA1]
MSGVKVIEEPIFRNRRYVFEDRLVAGEWLARKLRDHVNSDTMILAIPAGGVPVGCMVAKRLNLRLDVMLVRKIHIPWNREAGFGAVSWDGTVIFNEPLLMQLGLSEDEVKMCISEEMEEIRKRWGMFRGDRPFPDLRGKSIVLVDDGLASGYTMLAAVKSVRKSLPKKTIVGVPTSSLSAVKLLEPHVDKIICLNIREEFIYAVADAYKSWHDLSDDEVWSFLKNYQLKRNLFILFLV